MGMTHGKNMIRCGIISLMAADVLASADPDEEQEINMLDMEANKPYPDDNPFDSDDQSLSRNACRSGGFDVSNVGDPELSQSEFSIDGKISFVFPKDFDDVPDLPKRRKAARFLQKILVNMSALHTLLHEQRGCYPQGRSAQDQNGPEVLRHRKQRDSAKASLDHDLKEYSKQELKHIHKRVDPLKNQLKRKLGTYPRHQLAGAQITFNPVQFQCLEEIEQDYEALIVDWLKYDPDEEIFKIIQQIIDNSTNERSPAKRNPALLPEKPNLERERSKTRRLLTSSARIQTRALRSLNKH